MAVKRTCSLLLILPLLLLLFTSCAAPPVRPPAESMLAYTVQGDDRLAAEAPVFVIEKPEQDNNRIGSPVMRVAEDGSRTITIDPALPHIFAEERSWQGRRGRYTNLIYRIHFRQVTLRHLTAGSNSGLFVILTFNDRQQPVLITTLQTCGCYLGIIPTSFLDPAAFPAGWDRTRQYVFGEYLPGILDYTGSDPDDRLHILLGDSAHRVTALWLEDSAGDRRYRLERATILPMASLSSLRADDGQTFSFFETDGSRKDYVHGADKIWERLLISWWAFDWRVGEDKRLGRDTDDGPIFYTSLKPWARKASDLRDFAGFVDYWGWGL